MQLTINNVSKQYGKNRALNDVSLSIESGVYGILGANGAGKTTLINILIGVLPQTSGEILFDNVDIRKLGTKYLDIIGYMPQYPKFYPNFRVDEFLDYMCCIKGIPTGKSSGIIKNVLKEVNMDEHSKKKIRELSGGMRQRVGIAQAILNNPKILVLDEPTAGLDPSERIRFRNIISKISKNRIVLIATHIVSDIEYIANQVIILKNGYLVQKGTIEELCAQENGRIWEAEIPDNEVQKVMDCYLVSNLRRENDNINVKIISNEKPDDTIFRVATPHLEDVFLDIFNRNGD